MTSSPCKRPQLLSPYDKAKRIRNCAMALKQGALVTDLRKSGRYNDHELAEAREMLRAVEAAKAKKNLGA